LTTVDGIRTSTHSMHRFYQHEHKCSRRRRQPRSTAVDGMSENAFTEI